MKPPGELVFDRLSSPLGSLLLVSDDAGRLRALDFAEYEARMRRLLRLHYGESAPLRPGSAPPAMKSTLQAYFAGELDAIAAVSVETGGTAFQRQVWGALRRIPAGVTTTYGSLAATIGRPRAVRAVGLANGSNPIAIVVPCHRVVGAGGALTGYGGGIDRKRFLLAHEQRWSASSGTPTQSTMRATSNGR